MIGRVALVLGAVAGAIVLLTIRAGLGLANDGVAWETWVSGVGDDANPCTRTEPCLTFQQALSLTISGGVIRALDPGDFGPVVVDRAVTIEGEQASIDVETGGAKAIVIAAGPTDRVFIRRLLVSGRAAAWSGIQFVSGRSLALDDVDVQGFVGPAVEFRPAGNAGLEIENSRLGQSLTAGLVISGNAGTVEARLRRSMLNNSPVGVEVHGTADVGIERSTIVFNTEAGLRTTSTAGTLRADVTGSILAHNGTAIAAGPNSIVAISDNLIVENGTGLQLVGGTIGTWRNNRSIGNTVPGEPNAILGKRPVSIEIAAPVSVRFSEAVVATVALSDTWNHVPVTGVAVTTSLGSAAVTGTTDGAGTLTVTLAGPFIPGNSLLLASYGGDDVRESATMSRSILVAKEPTRLVLRSLPPVRLGDIVVLGASLYQDDLKPLIGRSIEFVLQTAGGTKFCTAVSGPTGSAQCSVGPITSPTGAAALTVSFLGDTQYQPSLGYLGFDVLPPDPGAQASPTATPVGSEPGGPGPNPGSRRLYAPAAIVTVASGW